MISLSLCVSLSLSSNSDHYEVLEINSVDSTGIFLTLTSQLQWAKFGELQTFGGHVLDERASV